MTWIKNNWDRLFTAVLAGVTFVAGAVVAFYSTVSAIQDAIRGVERELAAFETRSKTSLSNAQGELSQSMQRLHRELVAERGRVDALIERVSVSDRKLERMVPEVSDARARIDVFLGPRATEIRTVLEERRAVNERANGWDRYTDPNRPHGAIVSAPR